MAAKDRFVMRLSAEILSLGKESEKKSSGLEQKTISFEKTTTLTSKTLSKQERNTPNISKTLKVILKRD